ncbi:Ig-like domain-containing protein [Candidatus Neomarinimicrobiota bacterium]
MYGNLKNSLPRKTLRLLCLLSLASGQLLFAQKNNNQSPVALNDSATVFQDSSIIIPVLTNDYDPDGDPLTVQKVNRARGVVRVLDDGTLRYRPTRKFVGEDVFEYTIVDSKKGKASANVVVLVTAPPVNHDPLAVDDTATTDEDSPVTIDVLANDSDDDGDGRKGRGKKGRRGPKGGGKHDNDDDDDYALSVTDVTQGTSGATAINPDSTLTYTPDPDFNGSDSFTYTISDGEGGSASATVTVTVNPVNDAPIADNQSVSSSEDENLAITLTGSDVDGDPLNYSVIIGPANGQLTGTAPDLVYAPNANFNGQDSFTFQVSDSDLNSEPATVTISVGAFNDPPVAVADNVVTDEDSPVTINVLANDSDPEGDALSVENITQGSSGVVAINPDGSVTYTPAPDFNGSDSFTYTISDGSGGSASANVSVTINAVNDAPVAGNDAAETQEDTPVTIDVLANDSDVDGDPLTVQNVTQAKGVVHINPDGSLAYEPTPNFSGLDEFYYTVIDGNGGQATATVTVTVGSENDTPIAVDDAAATDEDAPVIIDVLANDSDPDGDALSVTDVTQGANGTASIEQDGTVTYAPAPDYNGSDSFSYTISDGNGGSTSANVSVTVNAVNDAPVADNQSVSTDEDTSVDITLSGLDVDDDPLTYSVITGPANGQLTGTAPNLVYAPNANFNGQDSFIFQVDDGQASDQATVSISIGAFNDPPVAVADDAAADEDTPVTIDVLANDSDPEGDALSVDDITQGSNGDVAINPDGSVTYSPATDFNGSDSFTYTLSDGNGGTDQGTVSVTISAVNDAPVAGNDVAETQEDTPITIDVLANDSDVDGDPLTIQNVTQANGIVHINPDGTLAYEPTPNFSGLDDFYYTVLDGNGGQATATVTVTVVSENDAPIAVDDAAATDEDTPVTMDVLANDSDPDGDALSVTDVTQGANGTASIEQDGTITYVPAPDFNGSDNFSYNISDGNGGSASANVSVTINAVNDAPVADIQSVSTNEDESVAITLNGSDVDGDPLTYSVITGPVNGQFTGTAPDLVYVPNSNFNGQDSFTFQVEDGQASDQAAVSISVDAVNDPPVAMADDAAADEDIPVTIAVLANDSDPDGDDLSVESIALGSNGTVTQNPDGTVTYNPNANFNGSDSFGYTISDGNGGSDDAIVSITVTAVNDAPVAQDDAFDAVEDTELIVNAPGVLANDEDLDQDNLTAVLVAAPGTGTLNLNADGSFTYSPAPGYNGNVNFTYAASDGDLSDEGTVTIDVAAVNDPPLAVDDEASTDEDTQATIAVLANDSDPDGDDLSVESIAQGSNGTVTLNTDGTLSYTPAADFNGSDSFTYTISDGEGGSASAAVNVTVNPVNDPPLADNLEITTDEDTRVSVTLSGTDPERGGLGYTIVTYPANGNLSGVNPNRLRFAYIPHDNYFGTDLFTYTVNDGELNSETATVSIIVVAVNDPPLAVDDEAVADEDTPATISVLTNDSDPENDALAVASITQGSNGSVTLNTDGTVTYSPNANFNGSDSFGYTISDGNGGSDDAAVSITITAVNDAPVAQNDAFDAAEDTELIVNAPGVLANDEDLDQDELTAVLVTAPGTGTLNLNADGSFTYSPAPGYNGNVNFTYAASDGDLSDEGTVAINVGAVNDAPLAVDDEASTNEDTPATIAVLANDSDPDDDALDVESVTQGSNGSVTLNTDGTVTYNPNANFNGSDSFAYTISDGNGGSDDATVSITVTAVNDAPVAQDDAFDAAEDTDLIVNAPGVLANDEDLDQNDLTAVLVAGPGDGTLNLNADGSFTYAPAPGYNGTDTFTYAASDGDLSDEATVTINVGAVNDAPLAVDDEAFTEANSPVTIAVLLNDTDPDDDELSVIGVADPGHGTAQINLDGTLTYTPDAGFNGTDAFAYEISDNQGGQAGATVTVYVNITDTAVSDSVGTGGGTIQTGIGATINIPAGALNIPVNIIISQFADAPPGIETTGPVYFFGPTGTWFNVPVTITVAYDPDLVPLGLDASRLSLLRYNEGDGSWEVIPAIVDTVAHLVIGQTDHFSGFAAGFAPNRAPSVVQSIDDMVIPEDSPYATLIQNISDYFTDPDEGDHLTFTATDLDEGLETLIISQELSLFVIPVENFFGEVHIVVSATDDWNVTTSDTLLLTVTSVNDAPEFPAGFREALASVMTITEDQVLRVNLTASDIEDDDITFQATSDTSAVTVAVTQDTMPVLVIVPDPNWFGTAQIGISATDGMTSTSLDPIVLTVGASNDIPGPFDLLNPGNGDQLFLTSENNEDLLTFEWEPVIDPDGDPVSYTFVLSDSFGVNWEYAGLESNVVSVAYADIAAAIRGMGLTSVSFWWSVIAIAGPDTIPTSQETFRLTIDVGSLSVEDGSHVPQLFALHQNYPNPFNPVTTIKFEVPRASHVLLVIYDMRGREIIRLVDEFTPPGYNKVMWNSSDAFGRPVPSGVYIARMLAPEYTRVIKMTIVR